MAETTLEPVIKDSILDTIGHTPLVRLSRISGGLRPQLVASSRRSTRAGRSRIASRSP